jgi:hypothetical protein
MKNINHCKQRALTIFAIQLVIFNACVAGAGPPTSKPNTDVFIGNERAVPCEVKSGESSESHKVISVTFNFSATVNKVTSHCLMCELISVRKILSSVKYVIESDWRLKEWSPRNSSEKETEGPVKKRKKNGETTDIDIEIDAGASADVEASGTVGVADAKAGAGEEVNGRFGYKKKNEDVEETKYELPPKKLIATSSGVYEDGNGVFFELRKTRQNITEGHFGCTCDFEVPHDWRGGYVKFHATSTLEHEHPSNTSRRLIWLYLKGDDDARTFASKSDKLRSSINKKAARVKEIEGYYWYPWFGYGSQAEKIRKDKRSLEKELKDLEEKFKGK